MHSTRFIRLTIAAFAAAALAGSGPALAQTPDHTADNSAQFPSKSDLKSLTTSGSYLAARLVVGVRDLKQKKYATAQININQSIRGPITDLIATLLSGWASYGSGDTKAAIANIDKLTGPEWYPIFKDLRSEERRVG